MIRKPFGIGELVIGKHLKRHSRKNECGGNKKRSDTLPEFSYKCGQEQYYHTCTDRQKRKSVVKISADKENE